MKSVLFVCLGNICRSPIAEGIAKKISAKRGLDVVVDSAGTGDWHIGESPCEHSIAVCQKNGLDISSLRARKITIEDFDTFDLVVALDQSNYNDLKQIGAKSLVKLGSFGYGNEDVPDPYFFSGYEGFDTVYAMIEDCVSYMFEKHVP